MSRRRHAALAPLLLAAAVVLLPSCVMSTREGEPMQKISIHFDRPFNRLSVIGRSAALLLAGVFVAIHAKGPGRGVLLAVSGVAIAGGVASMVLGWAKVKGYRIDLTPGQATISRPFAGEKVVRWDQIESMRVAGVEVHLGTGVSQHREWKTMEVRLKDGSTVKLDLEDLSVEMRGVVWEYIVNRAGLLTK